MADENLQPPFNGGAVAGAEGAPLGGASGISQNYSAPITAENIRFHAAGHLAAGVALTQAGNIEGARTVYRIIRQYLDAPNVDSPPAFRESVDKAIADPAAMQAEVTRLEEMFCSPLNTAFEKAGVTMGKG